MLFMFFFFKQKTAYEMRISDWSSDVCSSDLEARAIQEAHSRGDFAGMTAACPDEMVETIVLVGSADEVLKRLADQARFSRSCTPKEIGRASCRERVCQYV